MPATSAERQRWTINKLVWELIRVQREKEREGDFGGGEGGQSGVGESLYSLMGCLS